jgi:hypothetical protein
VFPLSHVKATTPAETANLGSNDFQFLVVERCISACITSMSRCRDRRNSYSLGVDEGLRKACWVLGFECLFSLASDDPSRSEAIFILIQLCEVPWISRTKMCCPHPKAVV